jgi:hypothetical protein
MIQNAGEVKVTADFLRREAVELITHSAPAKKIGLGALDLACAGAAQMAYRTCMQRQLADLLEVQRRFRFTILPRAAPVEPAGRKSRFRSRLPRSASGRRGGPQESCRHLAGEDGLHR